MKCSKCEENERQYKNGKIKAGSQRYRCGNCGYSYAPEKKAQGYSKAFRQRAIKMYIDGAGLRRTGRQLGIHRQTMANWAKEQAEQLLEAPVPPVVKVAEFDEIFTFIGDKKTYLPYYTVDRETRCFLDWEVAWERSQELVQAIVDHAPKANWYYSDAFDVYASCGITGVAIRFRKARATPIQWRAIMPKSGIIWLVWRALPTSPTLFTHPFRHSQNTV